MTATAFFIFVVNEGVTAENNAPPSTNSSWSSRCISSKDHFIQEVLFNVTHMHDTRKYEGFPLSKYSVSE